MKRKIKPLCTADYTQPAINIYLERLGLNGYKDAIDAALLQCEQNNVSPRQAVERILAVIAKCRDSQKIEMLMKMARLCPAMTWENFNFSDSSGICVGSSSPDFGQREPVNKYGESPR